ncbi:unnamed protein product, partial [Polarella glacialis]
MFATTAFTAAPGVSTGHAAGFSRNLASSAVPHTPAAAALDPSAADSYGAAALVGGSALALLTATSKRSKAQRRTQKAFRLVDNIARRADAPGTVDLCAAPPGGYCEKLEKCERRKTRTVMVGSVPVGSDHPIATQTMTTTLTSDVEGTVAQIKKCADMGVDIARITVQGMTEAKACEHIKRRLLEDGYHTPIVADIHFTPKVALACADFVDKVRVNPGNFTSGRKSFDTISELTEEDIKEAQAGIEAALVPLVLKLKEKGKAMRIGVNHGSLAERILFQYGDSPEGMIASAI